MDGEAKKMLEEILAAVKGLEGRVSKLETAGTRRQAARPASVLPLRKSCH